MINILYWNVIGIGNSPTRSRLDFLENKHLVDILAISEPMSDISSSVMLYDLFNMPDFAFNSDVVENYGFFRQSLGVDTVSMDEKCCNVKIEDYGSQLYSSFVYAKCTSSLKRSLC